MKIFDLLIFLLSNDTLLIHYNAPTSSMVQWLEQLTADQRVMGSNPPPDEYFVVWMVGDQNSRWRQRCVPFGV